MDAWIEPTAPERAALKRRVPKANPMDLEHVGDQVLAAWERWKERDITPASEKQLAFLARLIDRPPEVFPRPMIGYVLTLLPAIRDWIECGGSLIWNGDAKPTAEHQVAWRVLKASDWTHDVGGFWQAFVQMNRQTLRAVATACYAEGASG